MLYKGLDVAVTDMRMGPSSLRVLLFEETAAIPPPETMIDEINRHA